MPQTSSAIDTATARTRRHLLISMLQVAGIQAFYVTVTIPPRLCRPWMPTPEGDHMITAIDAARRRAETRS